MQYQKYSATLLWYAVPFVALQLLNKIVAQSNKQNVWFDYF